MVAAPAVTVFEMAAPPPIENSMVAAAAAKVPPDPVTEV